jgi:hypothetical protein
VAEVISWLITVVVLAILAAFVLYLFGLTRLPLGERPRTAVYDRFGRQMGVAENPDYHVSPGTDEAGEQESS